MRKKAVHVWLVGAGPGDPELLTLKAARVIARADVVVHDHLVAPEILARIPAQARRIYAGKERDRHTMKQEDPCGGGRWLPTRTTPPAA